MSDNPRKQHGVYVDDSELLARIADLEAEIVALKDRVRELEQGNLEEGPFGWGMREGGGK